MTPAIDGTCGPVGDGDYEVVDGDCIESIAEQTGHLWQTIWNHPRNAAVKSVRESPNVLLPGDRIHIPPLQPGVYDRATDARHSFVLHGRPSKLQFCVLEGGKPRANEQYSLRVDAHVFTGTTDGDGNIEVAIPPGAVEGELVVGTGRARRRVYKLQLGGMDPVGSPMGIQKRLQNLGYPCPLTGEMDEETAAALAGFQRDEGLEATGILDPDTSKKLKAVHAS